VVTIPAGEEANLRSHRYAVILLILALAPLVCGCATQLVYTDRAALRRGESGSANLSFPDDGREVRCEVKEDPPGYMEVAHPERCTLIILHRTYIALRVLPPADRDQPTAYKLQIRTGDHPLPLFLGKGRVVTLRFLADGTFYDVKEWDDDLLRREMAEFNTVWKKLEARPLQTAEPTKREGEPASPPM
jgi:hypothetical protein